MFDWSVVINLVVDLLKYSFPFALIFGLVAKMTNFTLSMILDKKIEIQQEVVMVKILMFILLGSFIFCVLVNIFAFFAEKIVKKKLEKSVKKAE